MTVYDYDLHDIGQSAFQSFQRQALAERSLADDAPVSPPSVTAAPPVSPAAPRVQARASGGGLLKKLAIGAAVVGATAGVIYLGRCAMSSDRKA